MKKTLKKIGNKILELRKENHLEVRSGSLKDAAVIYKTDKARPEYKLKKGKKSSQNWV